jgi:hypothetical protein
MQETRLAFFVLLLSSGWHTKHSARYVISRSFSSDAFVPFAIIFLATIVGVSRVDGSLFSWGEGVLNSSIEDVQGFSALFMSGVPVRTGICLCDLWPSRQILYA